MNNSSADIQKAIIEELQAIFKDDLFMTPAGTERALNFYRQEIPAPQGDDEDADPEVVAVPYCLVKVLDGTFSDWNYTREISTAIIFCIYNTDETKSGHEIIMGMIDKAFKHFAQRPNIKGSFIKLPIEWTIQTEEDTYPFYFGAFSLNLEAGGEKIALDDLT